MKILLPKTNDQAIDKNNFHHKRKHQTDDVEIGLVLFGIYPRLRINPWVGLR
jgi:hypothetical protein